MTQWVRIEEPHDLSAFLRDLTPPPATLAKAEARGVRDATGPFTPFAGLVTGGDGVEDGVWRHPDGTLTVAATIPMPGVTSAMWDWWFGWHGLTNERYRLWHPLAHVASAVREDRRDAAPGKASYIGNASAVDEYIGEEMTKLIIAFDHPAQYGIDEALLATKGTAICGKSWLRGTGLQVGQLCHYVEDGPDGAVMHSRFHLGDVTCEWPIVGGLVTALLGLPAVRRKLQADEFGVALLRHCFEEMNHLAGFLPELYALFGDE